MTNDKPKKRIKRIIWILIALIVLGALGLPKMYQDYHSAPYYNTAGKTVILEKDHAETHRLNKYQKNQFTKIAKKTIDKKDGPFNWKDYEVISIDVSKVNKPSEYKLVLTVKPNSDVHNAKITTSMIVKLHHKNLMNYYDTSIVQYNSGFSNQLK